MSKICISVLGSLPREQPVFKLCKFSLDSVDGFGEVSCDRPSPFQCRLCLHPEARWEALWLLQLWEGRLFS